MKLHEDRGLFLVDFTGVAGIVTGAPPNTFFLHGK